MLVFNGAISKLVDFVYVDTFRMNYAGKLQHFFCKCRKSRVVHTGQWLEIIGQWMNFIGG